MKNYFEDERTTKERNRINSEAYILVMIFLIISVLVKQFIFKFEFKYYTVEFIAFFGSSFYVLIRNVLIGNGFNYNTNVKDKKTFTKSSLWPPFIIALSTTMTSIFMHHQSFNGISDFIFESLSAFLSSFITAFLLYLDIDKLAKKRSKSLENDYDEDDE